MGKKLYVGNLSFNSSEQDLEDVFGEIGTVESVNIIEDRDTGRSRGFGFVEMPKAGEAKAAIKSLNHTKVGDKIIRVKKAEQKTSGTSSLKDGQP